MILSGNRCGHDPKNPALTPAVPIRKGKGGLPRILSLAAERAVTGNEPAQTADQGSAEGQKDTRLRRGREGEIQRGISAEIVPMKKPLFFGGYLLLR